MEELGYKVEQADLADFYLTKNGSYNPDRHSDWLNKINDSVGQCDFLLVESVTGTNSIFTDAIFWIEADRSVIRERHQERGSPLTDEDLNYYDSLLSFESPAPGSVIYTDPLDPYYNCLWKSVPSFELDSSDSLQLVAEEAIGLVLENQPGTLESGGSLPDSRLVTRWTS
jgi:hypothetical protein